MGFFSKVGALGAGAVGLPLAAKGGHDLGKNNLDQLGPTYDAFSDYREDEDDEYDNDLAAGIGAASMEAYAQAASKNNGYLKNLAVAGAGAALLGVSAKGLLGDRLEEIGEAILEE